MAGDLIVVGQVTLNGFSQGLAQLNTPLIEGVDVPDDTLSEDLVFVGGDESAESERRQLLDDNRVGWTISGEDFVWNEIFELFSLHAGLFQLGAHLLFSFAKSESLSLSQEVGQQQFVVNSAGNRVVCLCRSDEIARNRTSSLIINRK